MWSANEGVPVPLSCPTRLPHPGPLHPARPADLLLQQESRQSLSRDP